MMRGERILNRAIAPDARAVLKRDGTRPRFDLDKITRAIALAFFEVRNPDTPNRYRNDPLAGYGLEAGAFAAATEIASRVSQMLELYYRDGNGNCQWLGLSSPDADHAAIRSSDSISPQRQFWQTKEELAGRR